MPFVGRTNGKLTDLKEALCMASYDESDCGRAKLEILDVFRG